MSSINSFHFKCIKWQEDTHRAWNIFGSYCLVFTISMTCTFYYWRAKMKLFGIPICFRLIAPINHQHSLPTSTNFHQGTKYFRLPCNVHVVEERFVFLFIIIKRQQKSWRSREKLTPQWKVYLIRINRFQNL